MKKLLLLLSLLTYYTAAKSQNIPAYTAEKLMQRTGNSDTTYIINFWASWCGPCVAELPQFDALQKRYSKEKVKVLMVSFDFKDAYPAKLQTYVERKQLLPEVVWFSETNANEFIPIIDSNWSGGLPGTIIIDKKRGFKHLLERPVTSSEIEQIITQVRK
jgi:thiol-disulfide isomerase/thioredoxin